MAECVKELIISNVITTPFGEFLRNDETFVEANSAREPMHTEKRSQTFSIILETSGTKSAMILRCRTRTRFLIGLLQMADFVHGEKLLDIKYTRNIELYKHTF